MKLLKLISSTLIIIFILLLPVVVFAQGPPDPNDVPVDGGLSVLLAVGAAYGVKKYRDHKKNTDEASM